jgi:hypothetical protein
MHMTAEISLETVRNDRSVGTFPPDLIALISEYTTAICFFCAAFYGRNDVIFLHDGGIRSISLVDVEKEKLEVMTSIYPTVTESFCEDAFEVAKRLRASGRRFDVVVTDPFTNLCSRTLVESFDDFEALTEKIWLCAVNGIELEELGLEKTPEALQAWLTSQGRTRLRVERLHLRNSGLSGGFYWLVLRA